jgi:hypothetical protein
MLTIVCFLNVAIQRIRKEPEPDLHQNFYKGPEPEIHKIAAAPQLW